MDKLPQTTQQIIVRAVKGPAKFLSVPGQSGWTDQNNFFPPQQETVTLTVPLFSVPVTYTWPTADKTAKEVPAATLAEISLQFRLACSMHSFFIHMLQWPQQLLKYAP